MRRTLLILGLGSLLGFPLTAHSQPVTVRSLVDLTFGEVVVPSVGPGHIELDPQSGAINLSNAVVLAAPQRGSFEIGARPFQTLNLTVFVDAFICDTAYLGPCVGTPSYVPAHTFPGIISDPGCKSPKARCPEIHFLGGRFSFAGGDEGRWTTTVTIIADYQ